MGSKRFTTDMFESMGFVYDEKTNSYVKKEGVAKGVSVTTAKKKPVLLYNVGDIDETNELFIPYDVPSGKNSKRMVVRKNGSRTLLHSKACVRYKSNTERYWQLLQPVFLAKLKGRSAPYSIEFHFVYSHEFRWDYHNMVQYPLDLMVEYGWLEDDDKKSVKPLFRDYSIDKNKPGLYIKVL